MIKQNLFKIYIHKALEQWKRKCSKMGQEIGENTIYTLVFADDQLLIADDYEDMEYMIRKLKEEYNKWGLKINSDKSYYLIVGDEEMKDLQLEDTGEIIKGCEECKYLGVKITKDGRQETEIKERITKGRSSIKMLNGVLWDKQILNNTKINIYKTLVRNVIIYGAEVWTLNTKLKGKLRSTEMDCLRRSARCSRLDRIRNEEIRRRMQYQNSIVDFVHNKQLTWYGHVRRMGDERIPKQILEWIPTGRRKRGRPVVTWMEEIGREMRQRGLEERDWEERSEWRRIIWAQEDA